MNQHLKQILLFTAFVSLMEVATGIAGKMMGGQPFNSMSGWSGVAVIVISTLFIGCLVGVVTFAVSLTFEGVVKIVVILGLVVFMIALIVIFGLIGLEWLEKSGDAFKSTGLWWPLPTFIGCCIAWFARPSRR